jgi:hypothetical protein
VEHGVVIRLDLDAGVSERVTNGPIASPRETGVIAVPVHSAHRVFLDEVDECFDRVAPNDREVAVPPAISGPQRLEGVEQSHQARGAGDVEEAIVEHEYREDGAVTAGGCREADVVTSAEVATVPV